MSKSAITLIQTGLAGLGFAPGPADGFFGSKTEAAAKAWLKAGGKAAGAAIRPETSAMIYQGKARHPATEIAVHCSDTRPDWMHNGGLAAQVAEIRRWHIEDRHWRDVAYHWLIGRDGDILAGRRETEIGAGIAGHNSGVIHICLIGGYGSAATDQFKDHFTGAQDRSARQLIQGISMRTQIRQISGHNDYAAKACPGFNVAKWLKEAA